MWNARSVNNKRAEVEFLLHEQDLDVLCISESWLAEDVAFELYGYLTYRRDHPGGGGGGTVILVRDSLSVLPLLVDGPWCSRLDVAAVRLSTSLGSLALMSVYAPPDSGVDSGLWSSLIGCASDCDVLILCGDFNVHSPLWGARCLTFRGASCVLRSSTMG